MSERDPLEILQQGWSMLPTPEATPDLAEEDPITQRCVAWMADAWLHLEVPDAPLLHPVATAKPRFAWRWWALPSAAALLMSALLFLNPQEVMIPSALSAPTTPATQQLIAAAPKLIATTPERVEVLSGRVRLTMLRVPDAATVPQSTDS